MNRMNMTLGGVAAGAALMYFLDPDRGRRRRSLVADKLTGTWNDFSVFVDKAQRDAANRAQGAVAELKAPFRRHADDGALCQRVKSQVGRVVSHPHAICANEEGQGRIVLTGDILRDEVDALLRAAESVSGVKEIVNRLEVHRDGSNISSLQGGTRRESRSEFNQQCWTPALRAAAGGVGAAMMAYSFFNGNRRSAKLAGAFAGAALLTRAVSNCELRGVLGIGSEYHSIEVDKTVHIHAPIGEVFSVWSEFEKFPRFMAHIKEVRDLGNGRSQWTAEGPGRVPISWDAEITERVENKLLAWRSVDGSTIETHGSVRFDDDPGGGTRVTIRLRYQPPAGMVGHLVASLFSADPKREIEEDMIRLKSLLEYGKTRAHGHRVTREELATAR